MVIFEGVQSAKQVVSSAYTMDVHFVQDIAKSLPQTLY